MGNNSTKTQRNILLVAPTLSTSTNKILEHLALRAEKNPLIKVFSFAPFPYKETIIIKSSDTKILEKIELVVVIGCNEDLLFSFSLFFGRDSPPIYGINNSGDYTTPSLFGFDQCHFQETQLLIFHEVYWQHLPSTNLMKLELTVDCIKKTEATCQIQIHRGMQKSILILNIYIENKCLEEKIKIGQFRGDGLLISTPMGSLCKSLALNGPLMDRTMDMILITPICPLTMKFRPLFLPPATTIFLEIDESCRADQAEIYIDENSNYEQLKKGQLLSLQRSPFRTKLISNLIESSQESFIRSLNNTLGWGEYYTHIQSLPIRRESKIE